MSEFSPIDEPDWTEILRAVQAHLAKQIHTSMPGIVKSYNTAKQTATVQPAVQLNGASLPLLADVPVVWPGGAAGFLHVPLAAGDTVTLLFAEEDFSQWFVSGSVSAPAVLQRHGLHAVALPGLRSAKAPLSVTGGHVTLGATSEVRLGSDSASQYAAMANLVAAELNTLKSAISGAPVLAGDGGATFKAAILAALSAWPGSVAATKVKVV